jgi:hypothetical protein
MLTRRELQSIRDRATAQKQSTRSELEWKCLSELAHAADQLDALIARDDLDEVVETLRDLEEQDPFDTIPQPDIN